MSNRTTVYLRILRSDIKAATDIIEKKGALFDFEEFFELSAVGKLLPFVEAIFEEVYDGELPFLSELTQAGIPFEAFWETKYALPGGEHSVFFTETGEINEISFTTEDIFIDPEALIKIVENKTMASIKKIQEIEILVNNYKKNFVQLPWENQEENAKVYKTLKLIKPEAINRHKQPNH